MSLLLLYLLLYFSPYVCPTGANYTCKAEKDTDLGYVQAPQVDMDFDDVLRGRLMTTKMIVDAWIAHGRLSTLRPGGGLDDSALHETVRKILKHKPLGCPHEWVMALPILQGVYGAEVWDGIDEKKKVAALEEAGEGLWQVLQTDKAGPILHAILSLVEKGDLWSYVLPDDAEYLVQGDRTLLYELDFSRRLL